MTPFHLAIVLKMNDSFSLRNCVSANICKDCFLMDLDSDRVEMSPTPVEYQTCQR